MNEEIYLFSQHTRPDMESNVLMAGISNCDKTYRIERSEYDHYVIEYTVDGEGILEVDGEVYDIKSTDLFFLYKGKGHKYYCAHDNWTKIWVVIYGEVADALFRNYLRNMPNVIPSLNVEGELREIIQIAKNKEITYDEMVSEVILIVHKILLFARNRIKKQASDPISLSHDIKKYIDNNLHKALNLEKLSSLFFYSKNHIINVFRREYNITPYAYYEKQRIIAASELLKNTSLSVNEIAKAYGFENMQCFSKSFKKHFSVSPVHYRRSHF